METYYGHVRTPNDAIILFEACRLGTLPRVQRRLSEKERQGIRSGSVFVWDEREAGMRRWTDGKSWSASRVSGSFLTYREMEGKRGGGGYNHPLGRINRSPESQKGGSDSDAGDPSGGDGEGPDGYRYKPDGLMKQSFSITTSAGNHLHLISYYSRSHPSAQALAQPGSDPILRHIKPIKGMYPESTVGDAQSIPVVTRAPMQAPPMHGAYPPSLVGYPGRGAHPLAHAAAPPTGNHWPSPPHAHNDYGLAYGPSHLPPVHQPAYGIQHQPPHHHYSNSLPPLKPPSSLASAASSGYGPQHSAGPRRATPPLDPTTLPRPHPPTLHRHTSSSGSVVHTSHGPTQPILPNPSPPRASAFARPPSRPSSVSHTPVSTPPMTQIDPRLVAPSPLARATNALPALQTQLDSTSGRRADTRTPSPEPARREWSGTPVSRDTTATSASAASIPSIGALMSASAGTEAESARERNCWSRSSSRSPPRAGPFDGPQDIPHDKIGFREDLRALRVLDRAFKT